MAAAYPRVPPLNATELISTESGHIQAFNHLDKADTFPVNRTVEEVDASDYAALVLPGGVANPDFLRTWP